MTTRFRSGNRSHKLVRKKSFASDDICSYTSFESSRWKKKITNNNNGLQPCRFFGSSTFSKKRSVRVLTWNSFYRKPSSSEKNNTGLRVHEFRTVWTKIPYYRRLLKFLRFTKPLLLDFSIKYTPAVYYDLESVSCSAKRVFKRYSELCSFSRNCRWEKSRSRRWWSLGW